MTGVSASASSAVIPGGGVVGVSASAASLSARDGVPGGFFSADITTELSMFCLSCSGALIASLRDAAQLRGLAVLNICFD
jgi:hypothetical protein